MRLKKTLSALLVCALAALAATGCSGDMKKEKTGETRSKDYFGEARETKKGDPEMAPSAPRLPRLDKDRAAGADAAAPPPDAPARSDSRAMKTEEAHAGGVTPVAGAGKGPRPGTLTAGSFDDN